MSLHIHSENNLRSNVEMDLYLLSVWTLDATVLGEFSEPFQIALPAQYCLRVGLATFKLKSNLSKAFYYFEWVFIHDFDDS